MHVFIYACVYESIGVRVCGSGRDLLCRKHRIADSSLRMHVRAGRNGQFFVLESLTSSRQCSYVKCYIYIYIYIYI
jgi:hypothetical protein